MAIQTTITEADVKRYMEKVLGQTAKSVSMSVAEGSFDEAANECLYLLDKSDFTTFNTQSLVRKVRRVANVYAWWAVMQSTVHEASFSASSGGGQANRSDIHRQAKSMYEKSRADLFLAYPDLDETIETTSRKVSRVSIKYDSTVY